jgi:RimK family alpha-L-glutamate ligase
VKIGIITRNENSWSSTQLRKALTKLGITYTCFQFSQVVARVGCKPVAEASNVKILEELDGLIVRPIGRGSLEEIIFRMDFLHKLESLGLYILNSPSAIEVCADKYRVLALLEAQGLPVPRTVVTESAEEALKAFYELGEDVVVKPVFGSRGIGSTRISDPEIAARAFRTITFYHGVIYLQEFISHGVSDIRAFVVGSRVVAAMRRIGNSWKTNVSQGARPLPLKLNNDLAKIAVEATEAVGCKVAGVDIVEGENHPYVVEVNSQPGWQGLQTVTETNIAQEIVNFLVSEIKK